VKSYEPLTEKVDSRLFASESAVWGNTSAMRTMRRVISDSAPTDIPILLIGEGGTGKELLAMHIHYVSGRRDEPMIRINCRSFAQGYLPALARTGEKWDGNGSSAFGRGTIFLDNICELDLPGQRRLLDYLPEGGPLYQENGPAVRVISTARHELDADLGTGKFSEDLYFRLNGVALRVPPLRQRKEDIPELVEFFLNKYGTLFERQRPELGEEILSRLTAYSWPGNIRQLENTVKKIVITSDVEGAIADLVEISRETEKISSAAITPLKAVARQASRQAERELLSRALTRTHWNRKRAAKELQISYKALLYKLKQLGLNESEIA
jgi:two-component system response regulator AtoC